MNGSRRAAGSADALGLCAATAICLCGLAPGPARAQVDTAVTGVWSTTLTASESPAWRVADLLCEFCSLAEYRSFESLVADPANDRRSLQELRQQSRRVGAEFLQQLYTDAGRQRIARFKPPADPSVRCDPPALLGLIMGPLPMAIDIEGDRVIFRFQEWDTRREVKLSAGPATADVDSRGNAIARFDGATLVVESLNVPAMESLGTTDRTRLLERYSPSADGSRLDVELTIDDPETFREPLVFYRPRVRTPNVQLVDYDPCEDPSRGPGENVP